ncbi:Oxidoreductase FAD/NAD(P)-binding [Penicillium cf. griseofulvum]|uniref:NADPH-dependent diflavin oxidoreductase 1 n=1 Tax=Penicillium cf. griseofulvum TaxID=2972120 RepID=A0A9W9MDX1_9EURO|nr:Oxidoreductase FAD/NAD(P)-binding [Penicillium cf. griseofulvum]KAJ5443174.1 Oxidoreductase FAD/NAD(P)-binding [Penicillium cf. griseofulvum]KAJ5451371.1 Oxidoreductase FAD/NAD(P)-binding [Penicillium cf. griseofulvum]
MGDTESPRPLERSVLILYGSETGNAQEVAEELGALTERLRFATHVSELNQCKPEVLLSYTLTIFVTSTTGQGDFPANARSFWKSLLLKKLPATFLNGVNFTCFGLGDSSYPKYGSYITRGFQWLIVVDSIGRYASSINDCYNLVQMKSIPRAKQTNNIQKSQLEGTFLPWMTDFRKHLLDRHPLPAGQHPIPDDVHLPPKWRLQFAEESDIVPIPANELQASTDDHPGLHHLDYDSRPIPHSLSATLTENRRVTPRKHWQDVRRITLTVPDAVSYVPGDMIAITPKSSAIDVQSLIDLMGWNDQADRRISLVPTGDIPSPPPIPGLNSYPNLTLRALLMDYLDIKGIPRRSFFSTIAHYTNDERHKERLLEFTNPEYLDELWDYTTRPRRSILEILHEFDTVKIPWQHAISVLPAMRARQFSIASGGKRKQTTDGSTQFELLIAIVKYQTVIKRIREGVCTKYLSVLRPGSTLQVQLQPGGLKSSVQQLTAATVLIGPGTGVAPLRSMLWEKAALVQAYREQNPGINPPIGPTVLLYGGRNRESDFFFEEEWTELSKLIPLQVLTAFSRDQQRKIYVQDTVRENFSLFFRLLHDMQGSVYICGSSGRMPQAVREALIETFQNGGSPLSGQPFTRSQAEGYLIDMEQSGRYKQETW